MKHKRHLLSPHYVLGQGELEPTSQGAYRQHKKISELYSQPYNISENMWHSIPPAPPHHAQAGQPVNAWMPSWDEMDWEWGLQVDIYAPWINLLSLLLIRGKTYTPNWDSVLLDGISATPECRLLYLEISNSQEQQRREILLFIGPSHSYSLGLPGTPLWAPQVPWPYGCQGSKANPTPAQRLALPGIVSPSPRPALWAARLIPLSEKLHDIKQTGEVWLLSNPIR